MSISFNCVQCGKQFRVGDELAGRKGKCPKCKTVFQIPRVDAVPRKQESAKTDTFFSLGSEAPAASEDAGDSGRTKRPRAAGNGLAISLSFLFILLSGAALFAFLHKDFFHAPASIDRDLRYLPDDCRLFVSVNVDLLLASSTYERLRDEADKSGIDIEKSFADMSKFLTLSDIRRVTLGVSSSEGYPSLGVLRFHKPIDLDEVKKSVTANAASLGKPATPFKEVSVGRFTLYDSDGASLCQVGEQTLLAGKTEVVRAVLERDKNSKLSPAMQAAFYKVDFTTAALAWVVDVVPVIDEADQNGLASQPVRDKLENVNALVVQVELGEGITVSASALCKDADSAEQFKKNAGAARTILGSINGAPAGLAKLFDKVDASTHGKIASLRIATDADTIIRLGKEVVSQLGKTFTGAS